MDPRLIAAVLRKELKDGLRDRRAIAAALLFPLLGPALVYFMLNAVIDLRKDIDEITIAVAGADNAPVLIAWLEDQGAVIERVDGDPTELVLSNEHKLVLRIPPDFRERMSGSRSASIDLVSDSSRADATPQVAAVRSLLTSYSSRLAALRLIARGIAPEVSQPLAIQEIEVASKQQIGARAMAFVPMYIVMAAFICGMGLAVDSTAGERERTTLESLLINPVDRQYIVIGKWLAAALLASIGIVLSMLFCFWMMARLPLEEVGISFSLGVMQAVGMLAVTVPLALLATGMQILLGIFAKSFKDAQSYIGLLVLLPVIPVMVTAFHPITTETWMCVIPFLGHHQLLMDVIGGKTPEPASLLLSALSSLAIAYLCVRATAHLFSHETIIYSR